MKSYSSYKNTNIDWFGKIPEHWSTKALKRIVITPVTDGPHETPELFDDGIPFISAEAIKNDKIDFERKRGFISYEDNERFSKKYSPKINDIYIIKSGATTGNIAMVNNDTNFNIWSPLAVVRVNEKQVLPKFIFYFLKSKCFKTSIILGWSYGTQQNIGMNIIENLAVTIPPLVEQIPIVDFLDYKTSQIDNLVEEKEKLLDLLEEKRIVLITSAVTKGLNPNVKMKPISIPWIKEMPSHWKKNRIKFSSYVKGRVGWHGLNSDEFLYEGDYYLVTGTDFIKKEIIWKTCYRITKERYDEDPYIHLQENDLLITKDGTIGKLAIVKNIPFKASVNSGVFVTRPLKNEYLTEYMYYLLSSYIFQEFINYNKTGTTINHLYQEVFENFEYTYPESLEEQKNIVDFLNEEIIMLDDITQEIINAIDKLKEYRTALITSAVTGKIDVRNFKSEYENEKTY